MPLRYSRAAERDLDQIFDFTRERWGKAQARDYTAAILNACADVAAGKRAARPADAVRPGYRRLAVGSHMVFLRQDGELLLVVRVLHQSMDAGQHL